MTGKTLAAVRRAAQTGATLIVESDESAMRANGLAGLLGLKIKVLVVKPKVRTEPPEMDYLEQPTAKWETRT